MLRLVPLPPSANSLEESVFLEPYLDAEVGADFVSRETSGHPAAVPDDVQRLLDVPFRYRPCDGTENPE